MIPKVLLAEDLTDLGMVCHAALKNLRKLDNFVQV